MAKVNVRIQAPDFGATEQFLKIDLPDDEISFGSYCPERLP